MECVDRLYLNAYVANLQVGGQVVRFLTEHLGNPVPSPALFEKIGNRLRRDVKVFAASLGIPVLHLKKPDRSRWDDRKLDHVRPWSEPRRELADGAPGRPVQSAPLATLTSWISRRLRERQTSQRNSSPLPQHAAQSCSPHPWHHTGASSIGLQRWHAILATRNRLAQRVATAKRSTPPPRALWARSARNRAPCSASSSLTGSPSSPGIPSKARRRMFVATASLRFMTPSNRQRGPGRTPTAAPGGLGGDSPATGPPPLQAGDLRCAPPLRLIAPAVGTLPQSTLA